MHKQQVIILLVFLTRWIRMSVFPWIDIQNTDVGTQTNSAQIKGGCHIHVSEHVFASKAISRADELRALNWRLRSSCVGEWRHAAGENERDWLMKNPPVLGDLLGLPSKQVSPNSGMHKLSKCSTSLITHKLFDCYIVRPRYKGNDRQSNYGSALPAAVRQHPAGKLVLWEDETPSVV